MALRIHSECVHSDHDCLKAAIKSAAAARLQVAVVWQSRLSSDMEGQFFCDGSAIGPGGAFQGHMLPGILFVVWATHWVQGSMRQWFASQKAGIPYESQPYYSLPCLPPFPYESVVKVIMSGLGALLELTWHDDGFQWLICGAGTKREGHFDGDHINNWQHVQMYVCFMVSGAVDLAGWWGILPPGTEKSFLSLAFAGEAILMGLHEKHEPLDRFLHQALAFAMVLCSVACALEALFPSSYIASCTRAGATMMQGSMFIIIANTRFQYHTAWDISNGDMAPFQYSKVMTTQTIITIISCYAGLHIGIQLLKHMLHGKTVEYSSL